MQSCAVVCRDAGFMNRRKCKLGIVADIHFKKYTSSPVLTLS